MSKSRLIAVAVTVGVFAVGAWRVSVHSEFWAGSAGPASPLQVATWLAVTFGVGTLFGLVLGAIAAGVARLSGRPLMPHLKAGYILGLNLTAVAALWLAPAFAS